MKKSFYIKLILILIGVFLIHLFILYILKFNIFDNKIIASYLVNLFSAYLLYFIIDNYKAKFKDNIGFIYMLGSFLKFGLFLIFIYPSYKLDGDTTKLEFLTFFIPYTACLIYETRDLIKLLNNLDYKN